MAELMGNTKLRNKFYTSILNLYIVEKDLARLFHTMYLPKYMYL